MKNVWKLLKKIESGKEPKKIKKKTESHQKSIISPADIIESKLHYLNLTKEDFKKIKVGLEKLDYKSSDVSSRNIAAAVTFEFLRKIKRQPISLQSLTEYFKTSNMSVYRYRSYLRKQKIDLFETTTSECSNQDAVQ